MEWVKTKLLKKSAWGINQKKGHFPINVNSSFLSHLHSGQKSNDVIFEKFLSNCYFRKIAVTQKFLIVERFINLKLREKD